MVYRAQGSDDLQFYLKLIVQPHLVFLMPSNRNEKIPVTGDAMPQELKWAFNIVILGVCVVIISLILPQIENSKIQSVLRFTTQKPCSRFEHLPIATLLLNTGKPLTYPRMLILRTPKTPLSARLLRCFH